MLSYNLRLTGRRMDGWAHGWMDGRTDGQTNRRTADRQTESFISILDITKIFIQPDKIDHLLCSDVSVVSLTFALAPALVKALI